MFNQSFSSQASSNIPNSKTIPSNLASASGVNSQSTNKSTNNAIPNSLSTQNALNSIPSQQSQLNPASSQVPFMPYMDPYQMQMYQMYQMMQMAQMAGPFGYAGMNPYMSQFSPYPFMGPPQQLPDDQQSMRSYQYFDDTRSEKKMNLTTHQRAESLAGDFKHEPVEPKLKNTNGKLDFG